jgi:hypothetical protein
MLRRGHDAGWGRVMAVRILWALCLGFGAMISGIGIELYSSGAGPWLSYPVVIAGIALLPLASVGIDRLVAAPASTRE